MNEALRQAAVTTFEELAFTFEMPEMEAPVGAMVGARVDFSGHRVGHLLLDVSESLLPTLAENMLGEPAESRAEELDALKEVANVICGNVLPLVEGPRAIFKLSAPSIAAEPHAGTPAADVAIPLVEGAARLRLYFA